MNNISERLLELAKGNKKYTAFNKKIINTKKEVLWVKTPDMRKFAKTLAKDLTFDDVLKFLRNSDKNIFEEISLSGLLIAYSKLTDKEKIRLTKLYLSNIDSWALVDGFVSSFKKIDESLWWNFVTKCLKSEKEFIVRFWVIFMMSNFLDEKHIDNVFAELRRVKQSDYYVKMWIAWLYATAGVKFYNKTLEEVKRSELDIWTRNKALQKMLESYRFSEEQKEEIRTLKNK